MKKRKKSRKKFIIIGLIALLIILLVLFFFFNNNFLALRNNPFGSTKLNVLVLGYDSAINGPPRADTIMLLSIDLESREIGLLSIPRDTRVNIPGYGMNRINASHAFGGIELSVQTIEEFLGIPIDYYIETDFQGFSRIIDVIGGVEIDIKQPLRYVDKAGGVNINLPAGKRLLNGKEALDFVRYRESIKGDIGRVERQQQFIKALIDRLLSPDIIIKLPSIYSETRKAVNTNIPIQDISPFMRVIRDLNISAIETVILPGEPKYINGASYWVADEEETEILVNKLIRSKEYIRNGQCNLRILNGNGVQGQASELASELKKYGFNIVSLANAATYDYENTEILYYDSADRDIALSIRELIGGKVQYVELEEEEILDKKEDIQIIIGHDFIKR
ncbi:MAG: LCP family protein [Halanaerobiaceae bacterium]|jgi:LCP family protein required for cell wall assembly|nr:LCP family protein [Halanaerobiaceae bacterium]